MNTAAFQIFEEGTHYFAAWAARILETSIILVVADAVQKFKKDILESGVWFRCAWQTRILIVSRAVGVQ